METLKTIMSRKSVRTYTGETVSEQDLDTILKAACAAPVGMGKYETVHLTVIRDKELLDEIDKVGAQVFGDPDAHPLYGAPILVVVSSLEELPTAIEGANTGTIVENMALTATELGIGSVCIWGAMLGLREKKELLAKLQLPEGFEIVGSLAIGMTEEKFEEKEILKERISINYIG